MVTLQEMSFEVQSTGNSRLEVKLQNYSTKQEVLLVFLDTFILCENEPFSPVFHSNAHLRCMFVAPVTRTEGN